MDQLKKNLFWIILGVVVLGAVGIWFSVMPDLETAKADAIKKADDLKKIANLANVKDGIKSPSHVKAAEEMIKKLDGERKALIENIQKWPDLSVGTLNKRYADAPVASRNIEFDNWMDAQRKRLTAKLKDAGIQAPADFDTKLFFGTNIDKDLSMKPVDFNAKNAPRHRDYQMRILAIVDEIVDALEKRTGAIAVTKFETKKDANEPIDSVQAGAIALVNFTFHPSEEVALKNSKMYEEALKKSGWKRPQYSNVAENAGYQGPFAPVTVTSVDVEFVCHVSSIPTLLRRLETNPKYMGVLAKVDFERTSPLFPGAPTDQSVQKDYAKAGFNPMINTHYGEAPVKVFATLEFNEFDKAKAALLEAPPPSTVRATTTSATRPATTTH